MAVHYKIGFLGLGNMSQSIIKGLIDSGTLPPDHIYGANRSPGKLQKVGETYKIHTMQTNEEVIEASDIVVLGMKPQDLPAAIDPIASVFNDNQIVISLAAGITLRTLGRKLPNCRLARVMPNTPSLINRGVIGFVANKSESEKMDLSLETVVEDLFKPLGYVLGVEDEEKFEALTISCASGTGFVFELMTYWMDWIEQHGFEKIEARRMTVETFLGAALLATQSKDTPLDELLAKVASKKGVTAAGLESMRELEIERTLRYSFEKAALRNQELAKES
jgi:pyrroline-5-carboxylate reductase